MPLASYCDGSSDGTRTKWLTLAGMMSDDNTWAVFDNGWNERLQARVPAAAYMHAAEANGLIKEFDKRKGWDHIKVSQLIWDLVIYLNSMDKEKFIQGACSVDLIAHQKLSAEKIDLPTPEELCVKHCPLVMLQWALIHYPGPVPAQSLSYFFDLDEPFEEIFKAKWKKETEALIVSGHWFDVWNKVKSVTSVRAKDSPPMQAADLLAWATTRELTGTDDRPWSSLLKIMKEVVPSFWTVLDEKNLREKYT
jgi:hypothetical protein